MSPIRHINRRTAEPLVRVNLVFQLVLRTVYAFPRTCQWLPSYCSSSVAANRNIPFVEVIVTELQSKAEAALTVLASFLLGNQDRTKVILRIAVRRIVPV